NPSCHLSTCLHVPPPAFYTLRFLRLYDKKKSTPARYRPAATACGRETAALRDFQPAYVCCGSKATWPTQATSPVMSGLPPKADIKWERLCISAKCHNRTHAAQQNPGAAILRAVTHL